MPHSLFESANLALELLMHGIQSTYNQPAQACQVPLEKSNFGPASCKVICDWFPFWEPRPVLI